MRMAEEGVPEGDVESVNVGGRNRQQYYLETESRASPVYIYIVLIQFFRKAGFNNPKGLEGKSNEERSGRVKLCYHR
jgi:hypothetical protein